MSTPDTAAQPHAADGTSVANGLAGAADVANLAEAGAPVDADDAKRAAVRRTRMIVLAGLAVLVLLWFVPGGSVSWVRPAVLALAAGVVAVWYWRRSGDHARRTAAAEPRVEDTRDLWDALDRGEDLTDDPRV
ncbi:Trp biosynthesis-associated membrane protein [Catellatospora bangladeshensis]|uniref:Uncharacterized protein n=1 Tax=Catellatospora bangladeshensis TaxID=310355 RepID=A0A8J3NHB3_9ACTN|nr:Trp biosynthesis-associated membrane protein [Catellatospora bangladeshensis]GIF79106.1 hypothetical protein Cba03nite_04550 [Catellatospora bangladeshensis]